MNNRQWKEWSEEKMKSKKHFPALVASSALVLLLTIILIQIPNIEKKKAPSVSSLDILIEAVRQVEGWRGQIGKNGEVGPLQITDICLRDYYEHNLPSKKINRENLEDSIIVFKWYVTHYGINTGLSFRQLPCIWNGGPTGWQKKEAMEYCNRVMKIYDQLKRNPYVTDDNQNGNHNKDN
jgi:hypothetical protein